MGIIRRQSIQGTLILAIGVLLSLVLRLFIFTHYLKEEEIGLLAVLLDAANLFAAFIPLGSQRIFLRFLPFFKNQQGKPRGLLFTGAMLTLIGISLFLFLFYFFEDKLLAFYSDKVPLLANYFSYLVPLVIFRVIYLVGQSYSQALKKNIFPLVIKEILDRLLTAAIVLAFASSWLDLDGLVFGYVFLYLLSGAVMTSYLIYLRELNLKPTTEKFKGGMGKNILAYGFFSLLFAGGTVLTRNVDTLMIATFGTYGRIDNLKATGIYTIAFLIGMIIELPKRAIGQITAPFIADAMAEKRLDKISVLYHKSHINQLLAGFFLFICVWTNLESLFKIIPNGDIYAEGTWVVFFIGISKLLDMSAGVSGQIISNSEYYKFNTYAIVVLGVLAVGTNFIFIPIYGINGAAFASLLSLTFIAIVRGVYTQYRFNLQPFRKNSVIAFAIGGLTWLFAYLLPTLNNSLLDILYRSSLTAICFAGLIYSTKVSEDVNRLGVELKKRFK